MNTKHIPAPPMFAIGSPLWPGLSKLAEEAGEVLQVIGKLMGTGGETAHWDGTDLRVRLMEEMADVQAALVFVTMTNDLASEFITQRADRKLDQFQDWHEAHSAQSVQHLPAMTRARISELEAQLKSAEAARDGAWVHVGDELPDSDVWVLAAGLSVDEPDYVLVKLEISDDSEGLGEEYWAAEGGDLALRNYPHWMPLPSPPSDGAPPDAT